MSHPDDPCPVLAGGDYPHHVWVPIDANDDRYKCIACSVIWTLDSTDKARVDEAARCVDRASTHPW